MSSDSKGRIGFSYTVEHLRDGIVIDREEVHNLIPIEGINYLLATGFKSGVQVASWYMGIYENNYTPQAADTAATFPGGGFAGESTAYDEVSRGAVTLGTPSGGALASTANVTFTMNATKTIYGGFIASASGKGALTGTLASAVKFASSKNVQAGDVLSISASFSISS